MLLYFYRPVTQQQHQSI